MAFTLNPIRPYEHLVRYAALAYENDDGVQFRSNLQHGEGKDELGGMPLHARKVQSSTILSHNHVHLGIRENDTLVIAFRGTDFPLTWQNWQKSERWAGLYVNLWTDGCYALIRPAWVHHPNARVHEGFLRDFDGLQNALRQSIRSLFPDSGPRNIHTCGHSLGGALATLCALWCKGEWPRAEITCVTLGSPKVGNASFATAFQNEGITCYRLTIPSDPFPTVPNDDTERIPVRIAPDRWCKLKLREHGNNNWAHVGSEVPLDDIPHEDRWYWRAWNKFTLAPHHPWGYVATVRRMLEA